MTTNLNTHSIVLEDAELETVTGGFTNFNVHDSAVGAALKVLYGFALNGFIYGDLKNTVGPCP